MKMRVQISISCACTLSLYCFHNLFIHFFACFMSIREARLQNDRVTKRDGWVKKKKT